MRKIVQDFIDNPSPKLRKQLTTMELKYALSKIEDKKGENEPKGKAKPKS